MAIGDVLLSANEVQIGCEGKTLVSNVNLGITRGMKLFTPSYLAFCTDGTQLVGDSAKNQAPSNPTGTFFDAKRLLGRTFDDPTVKSDPGALSFRNLKG
jgi:molecular chaperone DnaK (HSP70)